MDIKEKEEAEAVTNASSIIFLAKIDALHLAKRVFSHLYIPEEVMKEISIKKTPELFFLEKEYSSFLKEVKVSELKKMPLDDGERAAISYCLEKKINFFLSDDLKARRYAHSLGIRTIGILGILIFNLKDKFLSKKEFLELFDKLIDKGYYISSQLYLEVMKEIQDYF